MLQTVKPLPPAQAARLTLPRMTPVSWQERLGRGLLRIVPVAGRPPLIVLPSASDTITDGMVIDGSVPPMAIGSPATLLAMMTATAPAFCAFFTFTVNVHAGAGGGGPPRSITAILPATSAAFVSGLQPSVVDGPSALAGSSATTTAPETPVAVTGGPNAALVAPYVPAADDGGAIVTMFSSPPPSGLSPDDSKRRYDAPAGLPSGTLTMSMPRQRMFPLEGLL